jgi:RNA polymerase sigma-70 factor (ECF subfamily)
MLEIETDEVGILAAKARSRRRFRGNSSSVTVSAAPPTATNEEQLIERLKNGDEQALEIFFKRYSGHLYNVAHRILGEGADSEEVIQDVFWTAYRKAKSFKGNSKFSTWLYRLTVNAALGRIRGRRKYAAAYEEVLPRFQKDGHHKISPVVDWSDTLEMEVSRGEIKKLLGAALDRLKPVDKAVIVLSDLEGLADKEIAAAVKLSVSAVKTRLHRARLFLRGMLAAQLGTHAL